MAIYSALLKLQDAYEELERNFYSVGDFPASEEKYLNDNPYISSKIFNEFTENINDISDLLDGSKLINEILNLIEEDSPIYNIVTFNEKNYAIDLTNKDPDSYNEENLSSVQNQSAQQAFERKQDLFNEARDDIKRLMEELLPSLIE